MEQNLMVFATLLALSLGMSACTAEKAPDVTHTPTPTAAPTVSLRPAEMAPDGTVGNAARPGTPEANTVRRHAGEAGKAAEGERQF